MTITDELIEQVARRICELQDYRPGGGSDLEPVDAGSLLNARDAIADHIALAEIMPPDRATLLAVADAFDEIATKWMQKGDPAGEVRFIYRVQGLAMKDVAAALRAKAGEAGE